MWQYSQSAGAGSVANSSGSYEMTAHEYWAEVRPRMAVETLDPVDIL